jgi:hypothetical protein
MSCQLCGSRKQAKLTAEILIHFPALKNLDRPGVLLFPNVWVCLDCGFSWFTVPETELASVAKDTLKESDGDVALSEWDRVQAGKLEIIGCLALRDDMVN